MACVGVSVMYGGYGHEERRRREAGIPTLRWYRCHGCGWEHLVDGAYHVTACGNPECQAPCLHIHSDLDGEYPFMRTITIDIAGLLERLRGCRDWLDCDAPVTQEELWALTEQLRAFRNLPRHANSCSNQNVIDPIGAWRGVKKCGCRRV